MDSPKSFIGDICDFAAHRVGKGSNQIVVLKVIHQIIIEYLKEVIMRFLLFALLVGMFNAALYSQETFVCAAPASAAPYSFLPVSGTFRALVIYCKFSDDNFDQSPNTDGWPSTLQFLPSWAQTGTIATSVGNYPFKSISDYYYQMSGGRLNIIGDVHPYVVIPQHESSYYYTSNGKNISYLTSDLSKINPGVLILDSILLN
jgi:hypothetical protein